MRHDAAMTPDPAGTLPAAVVPATVYDESYYRTMCGGFQEWTSSGGAQAAPVYAVVLERAGVGPGSVVLDVGTGRGELLAAASARGARLAVGVEYSPAAVALTRQTLQARGVAGAAHVVLADARRLPLPAASVDVVTMLDIVEHLAPAELDAALAEAARVLRPGGLLLAHTFPTATLYRLTYRGLRALHPRGRRSWPADPRNDYEHRMHVNEQTLRGLRRSVARAGLDPAGVRPGEWVYTDFLPSATARRIVAALARHRLTRRLGVADLWVHSRRR